MVVLLNRHKTPAVDWSSWDSYCMKKLGRRIPVGHEMSKPVLRTLGFDYACGDTEVPKLQQPKQEFYWLED